MMSFLLSIKMIRCSIISVAEKLKKRTIAQMRAVFFIIDSPLLANKKELLRIPKLERISIRSKRRLPSVHVSGLRTPSYSGDIFPIFNGRLVQIAPVKREMTRGNFNPLNTYGLRPLPYARRPSPGLRSPNQSRCPLRHKPPFCSSLPCEGTLFLSELKQISLGIPGTHSLITFRGHQIKAAYR